MTYQEAIVKADHDRENGEDFYNLCRDRLEPYAVNYHFSDILKAIKARLNMAINQNGYDVCPYSSPNIYLSDEQLIQAKKILDEMFPEVLS